MAVIDEYKNKSIFYNMILANRAIENYANEKLEDWSLGLPAAFSLVAIFFESLSHKRLTSAELVTLLEVSKGNISHITLKLLEAKMILEEKETDDRRKSYWAITKKGEEAASKLILTFEELEEVIDSSIENQMAMLETLKKLRRI